MMGLIEQLAFCAFVLRHSLYIRKLIFGTNGCCCTKDSKFRRLVIVHSGILLLPVVSIEACFRNGGVIALGTSVCCSSHGSDFGVWLWLKY